MKRKAYIRAVDDARIEVEFEDDWSKLVLAKEAWTAEEIERVFTCDLSGRKPDALDFVPVPPFDYKIRWIPA